MSAKVTLNFTKGSRAGESFAYTEKESLILGRADDCSIVLPEETVSRYHCLIEILPPSANFRDFGSGNGIRLNGETVVEGRFKTGQSIDEARESDVTEFALKDGDVIALSSKCELAVSVFVPEYCADCLAELEEGKEALFLNENSEPICHDCYALLEEERAAEQKALEEEAKARKAEAQAREAEAEAQRLAAEKAANEAAGRERAAAEEREAEAKALEAQEAAEAAEEKEQLAKLRRDANRAIREEKNSCIICGKQLPAGRAADDARICPDCMENPMAILECMFRMAAGDNPEIANIKGFRKIEELGRGGMGAVFKVEEEATGDLFALKMMLATKSADAVSRAKFLREASIGAQLHHPNILIHYRYGSSGDVFYVLQEICEGGSVDKLIERSGGKLPVETATIITLQILDALIYAHQQQIEVDLADGSVQLFNGIVHRDIKPANYFLVSKNGPHGVKLADFGMAKAFEAAGMTNFTHTGEAGGTPVFMPRQQIIEYRYAKPDVDVWAVAASYYFMLTGCFPKDFNIKKDLWSQALKNPAVPIRKRNRNIDHRLAEAIDHALIEKPAIGFGSALELKKAIEGAI